MLSFLIRTKFEFFLEMLMYRIIREIWKRWYECLMKSECKLWTDVKCPEMELKLCKTVIGEVNECAV